MIQSNKINIYKYFLLDFLKASLILDCEPKGCEDSAIGNILVEANTRINVS